MIIAPKCSGSMARPWSAATASMVAASGGGLGRHRERREPPVGEPAHPAQLSASPTTEPDVGRLLHRMGPDAQALVVEPGPAWSTASSVQKRRRRGSASSNHGARSRRSMPKACCSAGWAMPSPNAGRKRPSQSTSRLASSLASSAGLRPGSTCTLVPSLSRSVRPAATASPTIGSGASAVIRSDSQSESNRSDSSASTIAVNPAAVKPRCVPNPYPMRTFMPG